jgi:hypothetical protein
MENISPAKLLEVSESLPCPAMYKKVWCAYVFDEETKEWDMKVYLKKSAIPPQAVQVLRSRMYITGR